MAWTFRLVADRNHKSDHSDFLKPKVRDVVFCVGRKRLRLIRPIAVCSADSALALDSDAVGQCETFIEPGGRGLKNA
jgi:hypothetical protein